MVKITRPINAVTDNAPYASQGHYIFLKISLFIIFSRLWLVLGICFSVIVMSSMSEIICQIKLIFVHLEVLLEQLLIRYVLINVYPIIAVVNAVN